MNKSLFARGVAVLLSLACLGACAKTTEETSAPEEAVSEAPAQEAAEETQEEATATEQETAPAEEEVEAQAAETAENTAEEHPQIEIKMENGDTIRAELYPEIAPATVENFLKLIGDQFYDGLIFHRVIPDFMIQGGDPDGVGTGGPGWAIPGEFANNGFDNPLKHERGVLSMARSADPNSAGSQFFIMTETSPFLDGDYAAFGKVLDDESMKAVDKIVNAQRDQNNKPLEDQRIESIRVVG